MTQFNIHRILVAPLDWGLGHATRCIPLIKALEQQGHTVVIASSGKQAALLKAEFPLLEHIDLPGYNVRYSHTKGWLPVKMLSQLPRLQKMINWEHNWLEKTIQANAIDLVISDNRYGLWSSTTPSVMITHQLLVKAPYAWAEGFIQRKLYRYIERFTMCWVPDAEQDGGLAGILSHPPQLPSIPVAYMGSLCRFDAQAVNSSTQDLITVLLSGPEPQRSLLEEKVLQGWPRSLATIRLVRGLPGNAPPLNLPGVVNHLPTQELQALLQQSKLVICRSGYTSLMELMQMGMKTVLVPTPGQTEQEYLAQRLAEKGYTLYMEQDRFDLQAAIEKAQSTTYRFPELERFDVSRLSSLLEQLHVVLSANRK